MVPTTVWSGDWNRMARVIVRDCLEIQTGERVLLHVDPTYFPELTEQVRIELVRAGAVEIGTLLFNSPALDFTRKMHRRREDESLRAQEDEPIQGIFDLADVYMFLPNSWSHNVFQTEDIIKRGWTGRGLHFHWIPSWWPHSQDPALFAELSAMMEKALYIDRAAMRESMEKYVSKAAGSNVHVTTPAGTDLTFEILLDAHFHINDGHASKAKVNADAEAGNARDREEELPAGTVRTTGVSGVEGTLVVPNEFFPAFDGRYVGEIRLQFEGDHVSEIDSEHHPDFVQSVWDLQTGTKDRVGEFIVGFNPELKLLEGYESARIVPYFGFGSGVIRFGLGNNIESGGNNDSSFLHNWLFLTDATVVVNGDIMIEGGSFVS